MPRHKARACHNALAEFTRAVNAASRISSTICATWFLNETIASRQPDIQQRALSDPDDPGAEDEAHLSPWWDVGRTGP
jgi:hypothetical protein